jgi:hypothetical protein
MLSAKNVFQKNDFSETILRRKPFYVETNRALVIIFLRVPTTFSSTSRLLQPCESDIDRLAHKRKNLKLSLRRYLV